MGFLMSLLMPRVPQRAAPAGKHKLTTRELREKGSRAERKYEKQTGRNPRKGT